MIKAINSGDDLSFAAVRRLFEGLLQNSDSERTAVHLEIDKALFARSTDLYSGKGLPHYLVR